MCLFSSVLSARVVHLSYCMFYRLDSCVCCCEDATLQLIILGNLANTLVQKNG